MKKLSRAEFLKWGFYAALTGIGATCLPLLNKNKFSQAFAREPAFKPSYLKLHKNGQLRKRADTLWEVLRSCNLCPRNCGANRFMGRGGFCRASSRLEISSFHAHFGEEKPLVGNGGSGTIFFTNCGLRCVFCINYEISHLGQGEKRSIDDLAEMMLKLQRRGCHNINFVTPTHYLPHILQAVDKAAAKGLRLPLVYNTCGGEKLEMLKFLDGIIDIYLPDFKYSSPVMAAKYSAGSEWYPEVTKKALLEMQRQVGLAIAAKDGLMYRGLMIRHLVMPNNTSGTRDVLEWIADNLPKNTYINLMSQYQPFYKAFDYPEISRRITIEEYQDALDWARKAGLSNVHPQGIIGLKWG